MNIKKFYSIKELVEILGVSKTFLYDKVKKSVIPARRIEGRILIPGSYVESLFALEKEI